MTESWNYGDIFDAVGEVVRKHQPALIHGDKVTDWGAFVSRSNNLAAAILSGGAEPGDKMAIYMRNCAEYMEGLVGACKARLTHVNINYRYIAAELVYLLDNADATVCLFTAEFADKVESIREQLPRIKQWIQVGGSESCADVIAYEDYATQGDGKPLAEPRRQPTDQLFIYTGGTTGMPKGVMWSHNALWNVLGAGGNLRLGIAGCESLAEHVARVSNSPKRPVSLSLPPLIHGTGLLAAMGALAAGGTLITMTSNSLNAEEALTAIGKHSVSAVTIVGDAFARPLVDELDANPEKYDVSSMVTVTSSGVMWSREIKQGLLRHNENLLLIDAFSSSEAIGLGSSIMTKDEVIEVASFRLGDTCKVFSEDGREILAGSGESGMVAVSGFLPDGYYKDKDKTDKTFKVFDGVRYSIPGDWVRVEADGSLTLLGRGSNCINTAGEKVFPEEVEEAMKYHDNISDCLVVGIKDAKWGQSITAVIELIDEIEIDEQSLRDFAKQHLAAYKVPKRILVRGSLERAPNGKANYKLIQEFAESELGLA